MQSGNTLVNLEKLNWPTLEERRLQTKLTIFQKARLNLIDIPVKHLKETTRSTRQFGDGLSYFKEFSDINSHIFSFYPHTSQLWNHVPADVRTCDNLETFKSQINSMDLTYIKKYKMTVKA